MQLRRSDTSYLSRRRVIAISASVLAAGPLGRLRAQEREPTPTKGPPPCDGDCVLRPFLLVRRDANDIGSRTTDDTDTGLGVVTPNIAFEDARTGRTVNAMLPAGRFRIHARVTNLGSSPTYSLCVDFIDWPVTIPNANANPILSSQGIVLMPGETIEVVSDPWSPNADGRHMIVRTYDPWSDPYTKIGELLYVNRDRHLAHTPYV